MFSTSLVYRVTDRWYLLREAGWGKRKPILTKTGGSRQRCQLETRCGKPSSTTNRETKPMTRRALWLPDGA